LKQVTIPACRHRGESLRWYSTELILADCKQPFKQAYKMKATL
jgi:hypothetical protein